MMNMDKLKDREDRVEHIMRLLRGLPETCRDAAVWLLEDVNALDAVLDAAPRSNEQAQAHWAWARQKGEYILMVLLAYKQARGHRRDGSLPHT